MQTFHRPEHTVIGQALRLMNHELLLQTGCWFGGGTAIVLKCGEFRTSLDVDFLVSNIEGYRELRQAAMSRGVSALFADPVIALRDIRADQYGIRTLLEFKGQQIKFEIIREGRIDVSGSFDQDLGCPTLLTEDMFAEKLLANADRCHDPSIACRDAFDLGMLIETFGQIPAQTISKVERAYGTDIEKKLGWVLGRLLNDGQLGGFAEVLQMDKHLATSAITALRAEHQRIWPG